MSARGKGKKLPSFSQPNEEAKKFLQAMEAKQKEKIMEWLAPYFEALEERIEILEDKILGEEEEEEEEDENSNTILAEAKKNE